MKLLKKILLLDIMRSLITFLLLAIGMEWAFIAWSYLRIEFVITTVLVCVRVARSYGCIDVTRFVHLLKCLLVLVLLKMTPAAFGDVYDNCLDLDELVVPNIISVGTMEFKETTSISPLCFCVEKDDSPCVFPSSDCGSLVYRENIVVSDTIFWLFPTTHTHRIKYTLSRKRQVTDSFSEFMFTSRFSDINGMNRLRDYVGKVARYTFPDPSISFSGLIAFKAVSLSPRDFFWRFCANFDLEAAFCCYNRHILVPNSLVLGRSPDGIYSYQYTAIRDKFYDKLSTELFNRYYTHSTLKPQDLTESVLPFVGVVQVGLYDKFQTTLKFDPKSKHYVCNVASWSSSSTSEHSPGTPIPRMSESISKFLKENLTDSLIREHVVDGLISMVDTFAADIDRIGDVPVAGLSFRVAGVPFLLYPYLRYLRSGREGYGYLFSNLCLSVMGGEVNEFFVNFKRFRLERGSLFVDTYDFNFVIRLCDRLLTVEVKELELFYASIDLDSTCGVKFPSTKSLSVPLYLGADGNLSYYRLVSYRGQYRISGVFVVKLGLTSTHLVSFEDAWYLPLFGYLLRAIKFVLTFLWQFVLGLLDKFFFVFNEFGGCCLNILVYSVFDVSIFLVLLHQDWCTTYMFMSFVLSILIRCFADTCCFGLASRVSEIGIRYDLDI